MDTEAEAHDYDAMDHVAVNGRFCQDFLTLSPPLDRVVDVGTGTARIPIELCRRAPEARGTGGDLAAHMLALAEKNVADAGLSDRITLERVDAKGLPHASGSFGGVICNTILHHIEDPRPALAEMLRVLRPGGVLFVRDLVRPETDEAVAELVGKHAAHDTPGQRALFEASLRASFTLEEIRAIVAPLGVPAEAVSPTSDRHWTLAHRSSQAPS